MGIAPVVGVAVSAAGTVAGLSQQSAAARRQQQAIANQELIARDNLIIKTQQLEQAKITNEQRFVREKALLDAQTSQARVHLETQKEQAALQEVQTNLQRDLITAESEQQASQLLAAAAAGQTEAAQLNTRDLFALAQQLEGSEEAAANFLTQVAAGQGQISQVARNIITGGTLEDIAQSQRTLETTATRTRVAGLQGDLQRSQADLVRQQGVLSTDYLTSLQNIQNRANEIAFRQASFDIDNVAAQNLAGLESAKFASQAELQTARGAANLEFRSQQNVFDAQRASIQQPNVFGALSSIGAQTASLFSTPTTLLQSSQPVFGTTSGTSFSSTVNTGINTGNLSFGGSFRTGL